MHKPNVVIRNAISSDIEKIWNIAKDVREFRTSNNFVLFWPKNVLDECLNKSDVLIKVMEVGEQIIGFTITNINESLQKAELENIYIVSKYRKLGFGTDLLQETISEIQKLPIANIVALQSDAVVFYEKNGFTKGETFIWMNLVIYDSFIYHEEEL